MANWLRETLSKFVEVEPTSGEPEELAVDESSESTPKPVVRAASSVGTSSLKSPQSAPGLVIPITGVAGVPNEALYAKLRREVLSSYPLAAAFLTELTSPMARRIPSDAERYQASAETVVSESHCTVSDIHTQLQALLAAVKKEETEYRDIKSGEKAELMLPKQRQLTQSQQDVTKLAQAINTVQVQLEQTIKQLRDDAEKRVNQLNAEIRQKEEGHGPVLAEIEAAEGKFQAEVANFGATAQQLFVEFQRVVELATQYVK